MIIPPAPGITKRRARKGSSSKGGYHSYGGSGGGSGGGGSHLPTWVYIVIVVSVVWACLYIGLFCYFFRKDYLQADPLKRRRRGPALGRAAWKAFRYATPIQPILWASRKLSARFRAGRGAKNVGGTFYRKIEEGDQGHEQGVRDVNNSNSSGGSSAGAVLPAQVRGEPLMSPVTISKGSGDR